MPTLNIADLALAIIWLFFCLRGYMRGLVKEVGSLAALILGFYCAGTYHKALAPHLTQYISGNYAGTAAYLIIFTATLLGVWMLALAISGIVKITMTQWANRLFGGAFGLAKGVLITAVILFLIHLATPHPNFLKGSQLIPLLEQVSTKLTNFIPADINQKLRGLGKKATPLTGHREAEPKHNEPAQPSHKKEPAKTAAVKKAHDKSRPGEEAKKRKPAPSKAVKRSNETSTSNQHTKKTEPAKADGHKTKTSRQTASSKHAD